MGYSLIALDTNHIKKYVFGTDKLKEIRGASSLLDGLNREETEKVAQRESITVERIYANGGSGLFLVDETLADTFGQKVQKEYTETTQGGASVTYVVQTLPDHIKNLGIAQIKQKNLYDELELIRYRLREEKDRTPDIISLPSHPFMRPCDACGIEYAEKEATNPSDPATQQYYCASCRKKQSEDDEVKKRISRTMRGKRSNEKYLWDRILSNLHEVDYTFPPDMSDEEKEFRPSNFNVFRRFAEAKEYLGLIYADANNMGTKIEDFTTLTEIADFATRVDDTIHQAISIAIKKHLPIYLPPEGSDSSPLFPFDILLLGGDDIVIVTDATKAMDVALTIAQEFRTLNDEKYTLSVGVVLAPIKYPFSLLQDLATTTLNIAKEASTKAREKAHKKEEIDDTRINFILVTGGNGDDFKKVYHHVYHHEDKEKKTEFYATLRPYKPEDLDHLLKTIRKGYQQGLGRTKLHQMREAILQKNLTTAVSEGLAVMRSWRDKQRAYVVRQVYGFGEQYQIPRSDPNNPASGFPRVTFPWFADDKNDKGFDVYRTPLLDIAELYNFVTREGDDSDES